MYNSHEQEHEGGREGGKEVLMLVYGNIIYNQIFLFLYILS